MATNKNMTGRTMLNKPWLESISFDNVTAGTELEYCKTNSIFQDKSGLMWFATDKGLFRYDGEKFKRLRVEPTAVPQVFKIIAKFRVITASQSTNANWNMNIDFC